MFRWFKFLALVLLVSCGKSLPTLENIDLASWKNDRNACGMYRETIRHALETQKEKLLALKEMEIIELLGRPDRNELYKRNQKFYYYYITPSPDCTTGDSLATRLAIRFNAMGLAKEVAIE